MRLPSRVVADCGFTIRGLGQRRNETRSQACRSLWARLIDEGSEILIPAPAIAEIARGKEPLMVPRTRQIIPIPFDVDAADHLAQFGVLTFPSHKEQGYWKYDALIAACAATSNAKAFITLDGDYFKAPISNVLGGLQAFGPEHFLEEQGHFETPDGDLF